MLRYLLSLFRRSGSNPPTESSEGQTHNSNCMGANTHILDLNDGYEDLEWDYTSHSRNHRGLLAPNWLPRDLLLYIRLLFGLGDPSHNHPSYGEEGYQSSDYDSDELAGLKMMRRSGSKAYHGNVVPWSASHEPSESSTWYDDFLGEMLVALHRDCFYVLVFAHTFSSEDFISGRVRWAKVRDDGDQCARERVDMAVRMYDQMAARVEWSPRVVKYLGKTNYGYRLERLSVVEMPHNLPPPRQDRRFLMLYQRWALQVLSALDFFHQHGIVLNDLSSSSLWLRTDYSIAVARISNAGCAALWIPGECFCPSSMIDHHQWASSGPFTEPPNPPDEPEREAGRWQGDVFNWALMVYELITGGSDPIKDTMPDDAHNEDEWHIEYRRRCHLVESGQFNGFPLLDSSMLGPQMLKAWRGEYESTSAVLEDVRQALIAERRKLGGAYRDELIEFDWENTFEVFKSEFGRNAELRIKNGKDSIDTSEKSPAQM